MKSKKICTTTLFAPMNYGNALQMLSLHLYLREQGYDAEVLRHWLSRGCEEVDYYKNRLTSFRSVLHFIVNVLSFGGVFTQLIRERKIRKWLADNFVWSQAFGSDSEIDQKTLPYDLIIVGSDQVWNPKFKWPDFNMLPNVRPDVTRIAYAASFGTSDRSLFRKERFQTQLKSFSAVSMREKSGVDILNDIFGVKATLVCDPTLLHSKEEWCRILRIRQNEASNDEIFVYLVTPDFRNQWRMLINLAKRTQTRIRFFAFASYGAPTADFINPLSFIRITAKNIAKWLLLRLHGVTVELSATPTEFIRALSQSSGVVTDSFHGMMFATIFEKRCNIVIGTNWERKLMSARLSDFVSMFGVPGMLTNEPDASAMKKVAIGEKLNELIKYSKQWLKEALENE